MASIGGNYNPEAEPSGGYTPMVVGEYTLEIVESEYKATQSGTGMVLACKAQVVGGEYDQRPYYLNYNLENDNEIAVEIGQREFAGLRRATGVLAPDDTEELHFKQFRVKIGIQEKKIKVNGVKKGTGEMENVVKQYLFEDEGAPAVAARPASNDNRQAATPAAAKAKPWAKPAR
ncbi:DUF669 domain-containing protein [Bosea sp. LjRoot237]|uniref:DUF669 domain-containing protein n=1 Tax=Bosea sp. LjRoot237 TaxID=3342292 RepID=UPI003ECE2A98